MKSRCILFCVQNGKGVRPLIVLRIIIVKLFYERTTAAGQVQRVIEEIRALDEMPMRFRLYDRKPWHSVGLRFFPVDNYLVFYLPDESKNTVSIVRIMYGGRDIHRQLSGTKIEF